MASSGYCLTSTTSRAIVSATAPYQRENEMTASSSGGNEQEPSADERRRLREARQRAKEAQGKLNQQKGGKKDKKR